MGFFDRLLSGKVFSGSRSASIVAELEVNGKKYLLHDMDWVFKQDLDDRCRPCSAVYGGQLSLTIDESVDQNIYNWIINSGTKYAGSIRFYNNSNNFDEGAQLVIQFEEAICVRYYKQILAHGSGGLTTLVLSSRVLKLGNEVFEQNWTR
ncbi:type VI secretion system tube protein TssD [Saccharicrinis fermentans]|uniref:Type VI secretion system needle protein Hcp n=1 Tax=Saccharicrinis fermentans DSM 9555 = JCM 21142 TaxID=869213 RepID=W7YCP9_9BACT|nr:type VI secretion system tube protein TssD [Saccharicrinis fermentans]GAF05248.1 hypothetical protein JCM21142_93975 [Saccharicrinis fermentans DSM 9555 = JCM 21142]